MPGYDKHLHHSHFGGSYTALPNAKKTGECSQVWTLEEEECMGFADLSGTSRSQAPIRIKSPPCS